MPWTTARLTDRNTVRAFLDRDRALTAYALGDLDDAFWPDSTFYGANFGTPQDSEVEALALIYRGLDPPVLTAFGAEDGVSAIIAQQDLPDEIYYLLVPDLEPVLTAAYDTPNMQREWRMVLDPAAFAPPSTGAAARLGPEHAEALAALYRHAAEPGEEVVAFSPWQIAHGVFYGVWQDNTLIATAGTHIWSEQEGVAAIGNVFTRPDARGNGYGTACTAAVTAAALSADLDTIVLNVRQDNAPALHVYERLGYRRYSLFLEGPGVARQ